MAKTIAPFEDKRNYKLVYFTGKTYHDEKRFLITVHESKLAQRITQLQATGKRIFSVTLDN